MFRTLAVASMLVFIGCDGNPFVPNDPTLSAIAAGCATCPPDQEGEVGFTNTSVDIEVAVRTRSDADVAPWGIELAVAPGVKLVSAERGPLTENYEFFGANQHPDHGWIRVGAFVGSIPPDSEGVVAILHCVGLSQCSSPVITELFDDLADFEICVR